jgi:hypothetical protein
LVALSAWYVRSTQKRVFVSLTGIIQPYPPAKAILTGLAILFAVCAVL